MCITYGVFCGHSHNMISRYDMMTVIIMMMMMIRRMMQLYIKRKGSRVNHNFLSSQAGHTLGLYTDLLSCMDNNSMISQLYRILLAALTGPK